MYPEIPPRVEYSLTKPGQELMPAIAMMVTWAQEHFEEITKGIISGITREHP